MRRLFLIFICGILSLGAFGQCVDSDVYDVEDANAVCFEVDDNVRHIYANNYPDHDDNYNQPQFTVTAGDYEYFMCAYPEEDASFTPLYEETETTVGCEYNYEFGVSINGVRYDPNSAVTFVNDDDSNNLDWHVEATSTENTIGQNMGSDNGGHLNPSGEYHYHAVPYDYFTDDLGINGSAHSSIVGYAADGFPIYYKYVYTDAEDSLSAITAASSGYTLRSGDRGGDGLTAPDGDYDGNYYEDYEYSSSNTILDECNGRFAVTPDYPYGTYYYVITDEYPYIPRCFKGTYVDHSFRVGPSASCPSSTASTSCASEVSGCMDPFADNYNSSANLDDGSCSYSAVTWSGTWSNTSGPGDANNAVIASDYTFSTDGKFTCTNLTVNTGMTLTVDTEEALVVYGSLTNNGTIIIESGASLITYDGNSVSGNDITINRNTRYSDGKYSFVGTPVNQSSTITGSDLGSFVYKYNETTNFADIGLNRWEDASSDQLVPGKGYTQAFQQEISFTGTPNDGEITITGTYTDRSNTNVEGWVFVSNPYPAAISVSRLLDENTNISGAVYFWDDNNSQSSRGSNADYIVANAIATTQNSQAGNEDRYNYHIGSGQGFFVKLNDDTDLVVTFTEDMRVSDSNADDNFFRDSGAQFPLLRLNLSTSDGLFKQTVVGIVPGVNNDEINRLYDAPSFNSEWEDVIYSIKAERDLAIQGISQDWEKVQIGFNVSEEGTYEIALEGLGIDDEIMIYDKLLNTVVSLDVPYEFTAKAGYYKDRFELQKKSVPLHSDQPQQVQYYVFEKVLHVDFLNEAKDQVISVFDLTGKLMGEFHLTRSLNQVSLKHLPDGIYLISDGLNAQRYLLN